MSNQNLSEEDLKVLQVSRKLDRKDAICKHCLHWLDPMILSTGEPRCQKSLKYSPLYYIYGDITDWALLRCSEVRNKEELCGFEGRWFEARG